MERSKNKRRFSALIHEQTYNKVSEFVKENELITTRLTPGTILEIGLNLFFKELETKPLEDIAIEYLNEYPYTAKIGKIEKMDNFDVDTIFNGGGFE